MSNPKKTGRTQTENWSLAWQFARCELRHSVTRFRIFLAALMLGVAAIGAVGSVAESMRSGITDNARMLLGGDFELSSLHVAPCLLYTSPSPRDGLLSRMPSSA